MPTFNESVATSTRTNGVATDSNALSIGLLNLKSITTETSLSGTTGIDCSLVHGDEWNQMEGNLTENVLKNFKLTITQDETHTINQNLVHRVNGTTNDTRVGVHNQTNIAPRNDTFMHTRTEIHYQPEHREQKTEDHSFAERWLEFKKEHYEWVPFKVEVKDFTFEFSAPLAFEKKFFAVAGNIFAMEGTTIDVEWKEIKNSLGALATEIKGGKIKAAGSHMKAIAADIGAGLALNGDSPFA